MRSWPFAVGTLSKQKGKGNSGANRCRTPRFRQSAERLAQSHAKRPATTRSPTIFAIPTPPASVYRSTPPRYTEVPRLGIPKYTPSVYRSTRLRYTEIPPFGIPRGQTVRGVFRSEAGGHFYVGHGRNSIRDGLRIRARIVARISRGLRRCRNNHDCRQPERISES